MADINEILGRQINSVKELKSAIKELQDSLIGVDADSEQFKTTTEQLAAAQAELNKVTKAGTQDNVAAKDSLVGMRQEYKSLYDQYKLLTEEQRKSDFGKAMADSLETLSNKINDTQKGIGDFRGNVGRYAQSITDAFNGMGISLGALQTPLKLATGGANTFGKALKSLAANPIILILTGLVAILAKAAEAIKKNEELTNRLQQAFSVFRPVLDAVANAFDFLAGLLVKTVEGLAKVAEKVMSIIPGMKQAIQSHKELEKATQNLTKATREANIENSKKQAEIERLREEASATEDVAEKKKLLEEAKAMQNEIDQTNIALAQEELRIQQEYGEKTANSAEENEKLAAAQKKVNDAIAQGERNQRMYNKQLDATTNKTKAATTSTTDYRKKATELYNQLVEDSKTEIQQLTEKYEKEKKLLEKYHLDTTLLTKKYNKEITEIRSTALLNGLKQQREDLEREWNLWKTKGQEDLALGLEAETLERKTIPAVEKLDTKVSEFLNSFRDENLFNQLLPVSGFNEAFDISARKMKEMEDLINKDTFAGLGDEYKDIKDSVNETNAAYGLSITTVSNLATTLDELRTRLAQVEKEYTNLVQNKAGEEAIKRINDSLRDINIDMFKELFSYDTGMTPFSDIQNLRLEGEYTALEQEKALYEQELAEFKGTQDQKLELLENYYAVLEKIYNRQHAVEQLHAERTREIWDAAFEHFDAWTNSLDSVLGAIGNVMQAEIDSGKLTEKEAKKKERTLKNLEKVQLAVAIANIAANTAAGIMDVWRGYAAELPVNAQTAAATGPAAAATKAALDAKSLATAIIRTTTIGAQGTAQLAAAIGGYISKSMASASADGEGGGSVGVATTPTLIDSTPYSYTRTVQTQEEYDALNRPIWVSVEDISNGLGHQVNVRDESSF